MTQLTPTDNSSAISSTTTTTTTTTIVNTTIANQTTTSKIRGINIIDGMFIEQEIFSND